MSTEQTKGQKTMDKDNIKCIKVEVVEKNGAAQNNWIEYWSPCFTHPYNNDNIRGEFVTACNGDNDMVIGNPSLVEFGHWLNDDLVFLTDRMTCDITDGGEEWEECRSELADLIEGCTEEKVVTIRGIKGQYMNFRLTPMDKIPIKILKAYDQVMIWNEAEKKFNGGEFRNFTDKAFALIVEAVDEANR